MQLLLRCCQQSLSFFLYCIIFSINVFLSHDIQLLLWILEHEGPHTDGTTVSYQLKTHRTVTSWKRSQWWKSVFPWKPKCHFWCFLNLKWKPTCAVRGRADVPFIFTSYLLQHFPTGHAKLFIDIQKPGYDGTSWQAVKMSTLSFISWFFCFYLHLDSSVGHIIFCTNKVAIEEWRGCLFT